MPHGLFLIGAPSLVLLIVVQANKQGLHFAPPVVVVMVTRDRQMKPKDVAGHAFAVWILIVPMAKLARMEDASSAPATLIFAPMRAFPAACLPEAIAAHCARSIAGHASPLKFVPTGYA